MKQNSFFDRFERIVKARSTREDYDLRNYIRNISREDVVFGYAESNLSGAYAANLNLIFPELAGFNQGDINKAKYAFIPRAPFEDLSKDSHVGTVEVLSNIKSEDKVLFFEQGFIAAAASWSHAFKAKKVEYACLSYVFDDLAFYYMSNYESRLARKLNSDEKLSDAEFRRADENISRILKEKISKYNSQPLSFNNIGRDGVPKVLVVDQSYGDASTVYGLADDSTFEDMLISAIRENPEADILVKTHPDSIYEKSKRAGYYSGLQDFDNVYFYREPVNPYSMFEFIDKVYVGTSGMGFEALLAGCEVICFGAPFYAGWGLTDDRILVPHRRTKRSLHELFYYTYIWYSHYCVPSIGQGSQIEDAIDYIIEHRPIREIGTTKTDVSNSVGSPKVSIIIPTYNVESYLAKCLDSVCSQSLQNIEVVVVDDCSSDDTRGIISKYASLDNRVLPILLPENVGQGVARNVGLEQSAGEFVWFLDSDDYFCDDDVLEHLFSTAVSNNADMVRGRKQCERVESATGEFKFNRPDPSEQYFSGGFEAKAFIELPLLLHNRHFWTFLYRRSFLIENDIKFLTPQWEERYFLTKAFLGANKIADSAYEAVVYRVRQNSTARREKNVSDALLFLQNLEGVVDLYLDKISGEKNFITALAFNVSQFLHYIFYGFVWKVIRNLEHGEDRDFLLERLEFIFKKSQLNHSQLLNEPSAISQDRFLEYRYHVIFEGVKAGEWQLVSDVVDGKKIDLDVAYSHLLSKNNHLSSAINKFIKYSNGSIRYSTSLDLNEVVLPKIVIHIGSSKTGSTYLQHLLEGNRAALINAGVYIPEYGLFWQKNRRHKQAGHAGFLHAAIRKNFELKKRLLSSLAVLGGRIHTVILSSEAFFLADEPERLVDYFSEFDVEMIVYLRRQDEWANSQYMEFVAGGAVGKVSESFQEWLSCPKTQYRMSYDLVVDRWRKKLPLKNIKVRVFDKKQMVSGDLLADFIQAIDLPSTPVLKDVSLEERNEAQLSARHVEIFRLYNGYFFPSHNDYLLFIQEAHDKLSKLDLPSDGFSVISAEERKTLLVKYGESNKYIANQYLGRDDGILFERVESNKVPVGPSVNLTIAEVMAVSEAYKEISNSWSNILKGGREHNKKNSSSHSKKSHKNKRRQEKIINFGFFSWRLPFFKLADSYIEGRLSRGEYAIFLSDPAEFLSRLENPKYKYAKYFLVSYRSVYGLMGWRKIYVPLIYKILRRFKGAELASEFSQSPVEFCRKLQNPVFAVVGRLLFPSGEVVDGGRVG
ncbi:glycosyltransferase [Microbulbifer sp. SSSA008]|uniref:glycosyltransferase n=1 Tax=Microbulbifer sp. SSSA008 TaxID=3243380 RepID=UPI00403A370F